MQTHAFNGYLLTSALPGPVLGTHTARNEPGPVPDLTELMPQCVLGVWDTQFQANSGNTQQISIFMASKQDAGTPRRPSAAWDWGPAWSPMYPSNHALNSGSSPIRRDGAQAASLSGSWAAWLFRGAWARQGLDPASLTDTLDSRHITDLWDLGCGRLRVEEDVSEEPCAPSCHQLLCLLPPPMRKFFPLLLPTRRPTAPTPVTPTLLCYHRLILVG